MERAERERKEAVHKREEVERLKKEKTELMERNRQLKLEVQSHTVYKDMIGQMQKFTQVGCCEDVFDGGETCD